MKRLARSVGLLMILAGIGALGWALVVWQWQDPVTLTMQKLEQRELRQSYERRLARPPAQLTAVSPEEPQDLAAAAAAWRTSSTRGDAVARLRIPRLGVDEMIVNGTDSATLKRGPGRYLGSKMPGEGELVYVAGHRTTYGAPFSRIDKLKKGDQVVVELPYATFTYEVTGHRIVPASKTSELRSRGYEQLALQACHPRFFATERYIVYATPVDVEPTGAPTGTEAAG